LNYLDRKARDGGLLKGAQSLLHNYGMASHLIHADQAALDLMSDRQLRQPHERQLLEAAHACRIFSDQVNLWLLGAEGLRHHFSADFQDVAQLAAARDRMAELAEPILMAFHASQREFYARMEASKDGAQS
jgi:hypothetical protein